MQTYSLPLPVHSPPNIRTHYDTRNSTLGRDISTVFLIKAEGGSFVGNTAYYISRQFYKVVVRTKRFTSRDSLQTVVYMIRCAHRTWRCSCHLLEVGMKTSRLTAIEDGMGAKPATNGNTCDIPKSSPKFLFFTKNVLREYALGMFANLVTSRGCGTVPCFSAQVAVGNCPKW